MIAMTMTRMLSWIAGTRAANGHGEIAREREGARGRGLTVKVTRESFLFFVES